MPPHSTYTVTYPANPATRKFALTHLLLFLTFYLLIDAVETITHATSHSHIPPTPLSTAPLPRQIFLCWIIWLNAYFSLSMLYSLSAAVTTALGIYRPRDYPPIFGRIQDSWSVRRFWG